MLRDQVRLKAAQDIAEALSFSGGEPLPPPTPRPAPPPLQPRPQMPPGMPQPQGALSMAQGPGGMPAQPPAMSPLQMMPSFRSPPMAAALQGAEGMKGHPGLNRPVGFAEGGFVVFRR